MASERSWIRRSLTKLVNDDNLDLYALGSVAAVFTVLGVTGVSDVKALSSVVLALLAVLAYSQIRSRRLIEQVRISHRRNSTALFRVDFPPDLIPRRAGSFDILLVGLSMTRTVQGMRADMASILQAGGRIRVLVVDPTNDSAIQAAEGLIGENLGYVKLQARITATLDDLTTMRDRTNGRLEVRVSSSIPTVGLNCLDLSGPTGRFAFSTMSTKRTASLLQSSR